MAAASSTFSSSSNEVVILVGVEGVCSVDMISD
jgi:hypothetical protein